MKSFTTIWLGQVVSLLGSAMTWFAFTIWAWQKTGQATALSTISFFVFLPTVLFTPFAGVLVDRWNRKLVLMLSDMASALGTLAALILYATDSLQIWHIYIIGVLAGFFTAFQYPAYAASVTTLVPKQDFARAEGMLGLATALSGILAPIFAASLLGRIGIPGIMLLDLLTFLAAFGTLLWVRIPQPAVSETGQASRGSLWQETRFGFAYIHQRTSLLALTGLFISANIFLAIGATLMTPLILSATGNNESALATVMSAGAFGGVVGGGLLSIWGGPRKRIHGVLLGGFGASLLGIIWLGLSQTILLWAIGAFFFAFFEPFVEGGNLAIWQAKVDADVQGRVFSARQLLVQVPYLLGIFVSGYLAEAWAIAPVFIIAGTCGVLIFAASYAIRNIRAAETILPDAQHQEPAVASKVVE